MYHYRSVNASFKRLQLSSISAALGRIHGLGQLRRPKRGWIHTIRVALELSLDDVARRLGVTRSVVASFEKAEADDRITLASLRKTAEAMGCELAYVLLPKGSLAELKERALRDNVARHVRAAEHTMALEDQAVGSVEQKIADETKRALQKG